MPATVARLLLAVLSLGLAAGCAQCERRLLFQPHAYPQGNWQPDDLAFEDAWFAADDGTRLHGWFVPHESPSAVVLFVHGNRGNVASQAKTLRGLHQHHPIALMTFDYRGYGRSEGTPSEEGMMRDARAARRWLAQRTGVGERDIVILGHSLGGAVAVDLAAGDGARGLVLGSTFASLPEAVGHHMPWIPAQNVLTHHFDSRSKIKRYQGPLLQVHGDRDWLVPIESGHELYKAANGPKRFVVIGGGGHKGPPAKQFHEEFSQFLASLPPERLARY